LTLRAQANCENKTAFIIENNLSIARTLRVGTTVPSRKKNLNSFDTYLCSVGDTVQTKQSQNKHTRRRLEAKPTPPPATP